MLILEIDWKDKTFRSSFKCRVMFIGIVLINLNETITRPLGALRGIKVLCHVLSAIVSPTKVE